MKREKREDKLKECENSWDCTEGCMQCMFCGAPPRKVNDDCEGCCGHRDCVPYARLSKSSSELTKNKELIEIIEIPKRFGLRRK